MFNVFVARNTGHYRRGQLFRRPFSFPGQQNGRAKVYTGWQQPSPCPSLSLLRPTCSWKEMWVSLVSLLMFTPYLERCQVIYEWTTAKALPVLAYCGVNVTELSFYMLNVAFPHGRDDLKWFSTQKAIFVVLSFSEHSGVYEPFCYHCTRL